MTAHSPFGQAERPTGRWLPYLRLGTAAGMCAVAVGLLQLGVAGMSLNEGVLVLARNVIGFTGLGLLCSLVTGGLLAWTLPLGYMAFCQYALLASWTAPWTWPGRPPGDRGPGSARASAWRPACCSTQFEVRASARTTITPKLPRKVPGTRKPVYSNVTRTSSLACRPKRSFIAF
jgi:hypothetical protein